MTERRRLAPAISVEGCSKLTLQTTKEFGWKDKSWATTVLLFAALLFLVGCQGVSAGPNIQQQQYGTLYLPQTLNFGTVAAGNSSTLTLTATNSGQGAVTVSSATISTQYFLLTAPTLPVTIASGQAATISIAFSPNVAGTFDATLTVVSNATDAQTSVSLSGTGSSVTTPPGQLSASPATIPIGNVTVGSSGTGSGILAASNEAVTVTAASSNNSAFTISGLSFPVTIPAGDSVPFTVTFTPQATGSASATLSFTSNAETSPSTGTATGTGTAPPTYTVSLAWDASSSPDISGYNIYRAVYSGSCGTFSKLNASLNTGLSYSDTVVEDGTSYCYATTAVNTSNEESGYSNVVSNVQIPAP